MQAQVTRALVTVVPDMVAPLLKDLAAELLDTAPPQWLIDRWKYLEFNAKIWDTDTISDFSARVTRLTRSKILNSESTLSPNPHMKMWW